MTPSFGEPNFVAIGFFLAFIAFSLGITAWAARRTHTADHFYTALKTGFCVQRVAALDGDLPGTRLSVVLEKPQDGAEMGGKVAPGDAPERRAEALRRYERWYWLTAASLRKKFTHWLRQRE